MRRIGPVLAALAVVLSACGAGETRVIVAAGTTLVDSGLVDRLVSEYEASHPGIEVSVVGRSTSEILELGARGAADLLITHAAAPEAEFLRTHPDAIAVSLFSSRFLLVGPADRAEELSGVTNGEAFAHIAAEGWAFVTRADGSGSYLRELEVWDDAGIDPSGAAWYAATGQGMGLSLQVASAREAFILVEDGSFRAAEDVINLVPVTTTDVLPNPYTAIVPTPAGSAADLLEWLVSPAGAAAVAVVNEELFGDAVYS